jgi:hypothetical protein
MALALLVVGTLGAVTWHFRSSQPLESWLPLGGLSFRSSEVVGDPPPLHQGLPPSPPEINLEAIEGLLGWHDARAALVQAQTWQQVLLDFAVPASDPRLVRLAKLIKQLEERTAAKPVPPPACVEDFRRTLQALREALNAKDLDVAKTAVERADTLFRHHPQELTHYGRSLLTLKSRYAQLVREREGRSRIRVLLGEAEQQLREDSPTRAAEVIAEVRFLGMGTPMEESEFQALDHAVRDLERELRFTRESAPSITLKSALRRTTGRHVTPNLPWPLTFSRHWEEALTPPISPP